MRVNTCITRSAREIFVFPGKAKKEVIRYVYGRAKKIHVQIGNMGGHIGKDKGPSGRANIRNSNQHQLEQKVLVRTYHEHGRVLNSIT